MVRVAQAPREATQADMSGLNMGNVDGTGFNSVLNEAANSVGSVDTGLPTGQVGGGVSVNHAPKKRPEGQVPHGTPVMVDDDEQPQNPPANRTSGTLIEFRTFKAEVEGESPDAPCGSIRLRESPLSLAMLFSAAKGESVIANDNNVGEQYRVANLRDDGSLHWLRNDEDVAELEGRDVTLVLLRYGAQPAAAKWYERYGLSSRLKTPVLAPRNASSVVTSIEQSLTENEVDRTPRTSPGELNGEAETSLDGTSPNSLAEHPGCQGSSMIAAADQPSPEQKLDVPASSADDNLAAATKIGRLLACDDANMIDPAAYTLPNVNPREESPRSTPSQSTPSDPTSLLSTDSDPSATDWDPFKPLQPPSPPRETIDADVDMPNATQESAKGNGDINGAGIEVVGKRKRSESDLNYEPGIGSSINLTGDDDDDDNLDADLADQLMKEDHGGITEESTATLNHLFGRGVGSEYGADDPVPLLGFLPKHYPKFQQLHSIFTMCRQRQMHEYEDEHGNKQGVSPVLGHEMGYGKTMHPLAMYIINILMGEMEKDITETPRRHCTKGVKVCPGGLWKKMIRCKCEPSNVYLKAFHYVPGAHLHIMPGGLVNQFLDEWKDTVDLDALEKLTGVRPVLMMAYGLNSERRTNVKVETAESMNFKAFLHPNNNWNDIAKKVHADRFAHPHAWIEEVETRSWEGVFSQPRQPKTEMLMCIASHKTLGTRFDNAVKRVVVPSLADVPDLWPLKCTGDADTCMSGVGTHKQEGTQHRGPKTSVARIAVGLNIREITVDESHKVVNGGVPKFLRKLVSTVRHIFGRGPWVTAMSGTPLPKTYYDILPLLQTMMVKEWKNNEILSIFTTDPSELFADFKRVTDSIAAGKVLDTTWDALGYRQSDDDQVKDLVRQWRNEREQPVKRLLRAMMVRYTDETTMYDKKLMPLDALIEKVVPCAPVADMNHLLDDYRKAYIESTTKLAILQKERNEGGVRKTKRTKAITGADAPGSERKWRERVRPYLMAKDIPYIAVIVKDNPDLLTSNGLRSRGGYQDMKKWHYASKGDNPKNLHDSSGKAIELCSRLEKRWGKAWRKQVGSTKKTTFTEEDILNRLEPVLITVFETPLAPFVHAILEYRFLV
ncbi:hypothetical protein LTR49_022931 [Elasticomyces elasticus]|nr:hypothetical protein LTR49_022931 [Elasticomyces elasticus]